MTESEWLTCGDVFEMLKHASQSPASITVTNRKAILFAVGCCLRVLPRVRSRVGKIAIEWVEMTADGQSTKRDNYSMATSLNRACKKSQDEGERHALTVIDAARITTTISNSPVAVWQVANRATRHDPPEAKRREEQVHGAMVRDIFGNPYRPVSVDPSWLTSTVVSLARQMYDSRDFSAMPILADALQDAGCDNADILNHCREPGGHVRGCWVVDLLLGKS